MTSCQSSRTGPCGCKHAPETCRLNSRRLPRSSDAEISARQALQHQQMRATLPAKRSTKMRATTARGAGGRLTNSLCMPLLQQAEEGQVNPPVEVTYLAWAQRARMAVSVHRGVRWPRTRAGRGIMLAVSKAVRERAGRGGWGGAARGVGLRHPGARRQGLLRWKGKRAGCRRRLLKSPTARWMETARKQVVPMNSLPICLWHPH